MTFGVSGTHASSYTVTQPSPTITASIYSSAVWTSTANNESWSTAGDWQNNVAGTGAGNTADFSQVDITADTTVNLDQNYTIGNLVFGNTDSNPNANWILANNTLTLAGTTPTVTVGSLGTGKSATISSAIAGTQGLTKAGNGTLTLSGADTYSGNTTISAGTLALDDGLRRSAVGGGAYAAANVTLMATTLDTAAEFQPWPALGAGSTLDASAGQTLTVNTLLPAPAH